MAEIKKYLINLLKQKIKLVDINEGELTRADYLRGGLIDSLQFIEMIDEIEKKFQITFSSNELQLDNFRNVNGLAKIINRLINNNGQKWTS